MCTLYCDTSNLMVWYFRGWVRLSLKKYLPYYPHIWSTGGMILDKKINQDSHKKNRPAATMFSTKLICTDMGSHPKA